MDGESLHRLAALARSCLGLAEAELERAQRRTAHLRLRILRQRLGQLKRLAALLDLLAHAGKGEEGDG